MIAGKTKVDVRTKARGRARVTGGKGTATRTMAVLSSILSYAVGEGYIAANPAFRIVMPAYEKRRQRLDDDGYRQLEMALASSKQQEGAWQPILAVRAIALTGCRRGEIANLRRSEVMRRVMPFVSRTPRLVLASALSVMRR